MTSPSVPVESRPDQFAQFRGTVIFQNERNLPPQMYCTDCGWDSGDCPTKYLSARAEYHLNETNGTHHVFWFQRIIRRYEDVGPEFWAERFRLATGASTYEQCYEWTHSLGQTIGDLENQRDRARDLAAHLREALVAVSRNLDAMERNVRQNPPGAYWAGVWAAVGSTRKFLAPALAAHLEAEQAEEQQ